MSRFWSVLMVVVACLVAVNFASAQEKKHGKGGHMNPEARWAAICKAVDKADADKLTADQFVDGFVKSVPNMAPKQVKDGAKDRAAKIAKKIKDSDGNVTKDVFVKDMKEQMKKWREKQGERRTISPSSPGSANNEALFRRSP